MNCNEDVTNKEPISYCFPLQFHRWIMKVNIHLLTLMKPMEPQLNRNR